MSKAVVVRAGLVRHLKRGLRTELGFAAQQISSFMLDFESDPPGNEYERTLEIFNTACSLLNDLKPTSSQAPSDIKLDLSSNSLLVLKALEGQLNAEVDRLYEAALYGPNSDASRREVDALRELVVEVKLHVLREGGGPAEQLRTQLGVHVRRRHVIRARRGSRPRR